MARGLYALQLMPWIEALQSDQLLVMSIGLTTAAVPLFAAVMQYPITCNDNDVVLHFSD